MDKLDLILEKLSLERFKGLPIVKNLSKSTKQPAEVIVCAGLALFVLLCLFRPVGWLLTTLVALIVPAIESIDCIENTRSTEFERLLIYWIVFGATQIFSNIFGCAFCWVPFAPLLKFAFLMAVYLPKFDLSSKISALLKARCAAIEPKVDGILGDLNERAKSASEVFKKKKD